MPDTPVRPRRRILILHLLNHYSITSGISDRTTTSCVSNVIPLTLLLTKVRTTKSTYTSRKFLLSLLIIYSLLWSICDRCGIIDMTKPRTTVTNSTTIQMMIRSILQSATTLNSGRRRTATQRLPTTILVAAFHCVTFPNIQCMSYITGRQSPPFSSTKHPTGTCMLLRNHGRHQSSLMIQKRCYTTKNHLSSTTAHTSAANVGAIPIDTKPILLQHIEFKSTTTTTTTTTTSSVTTTNTHENQEEQNVPVVIFLHGLLGNKRNFASIGRSIAATTSHESSKSRQRIIYSLDLRNHGDSFLLNRNPNHKEAAATSLIDMSYRTMACDVIHFCNVHNITHIDTLIGHSIGGKVAQYVRIAVSF